MSSRPHKGVCVKCRPVGQGQRHAKKELNPENVVMMSLGSVQSVHKISNALFLARLSCKYRVKLESGDTLVFGE